MNVRDVMAERVLTGRPEMPLKVRRTSSRPRRIQPLRRRPRPQTTLRRRNPFRAEVTPSQLWASWTRALDAAAAACDAASADWAVTKVEVETLRRRVREERGWLAGVDRDLLSRRHSGASAAALRKPD
jgi:hypothetical protein